jgi:spore coat protein A
MNFNVVAATSADPPLLIHEATDLSAGIDPFLDPKRRATRQLTLNEDMDEFGRLRQVIGNLAAPDGSPYEGQNWESVHIGDTEIWEIYNKTGDVHPMHFHLVNVQILNRQLYAGGNDFFNFTGPLIPPEPNERGWKETVPMYPGTVTRVIMQFTLSPIKKASGKVILTPESPRTGGNEYVWHCHILEHEEHDMMHALIVT